MSANVIKAHPGLKPLEDVDEEMYELIEQEKRRQVRPSLRVPFSAGSQQPLTPP